MLRKIGTLDLKIYEKFVLQAVKNGLSEIGLYQQVNHSSQKILVSM